MTEWTGGGYVSARGARTVDIEWMKIETPRTALVLGVVDQPRATRLLADDADFQLRDDVGVQTDRDGALAERLDGLVELDAPALDLHAVLVEEVDEILRGDRAEELAFLGRLPPLLVGEQFDPVTQSLGVALDAIGLGVRLLLDVIEVLEIARGGAERQLLRAEQVAGVAVRHVSDLAASAELLHVVEQDDFHRPRPS